jgi:hypothetical protein
MQFYNLYYKLFFTSLLLVLVLLYGGLNAQNGTSKIPQVGDHYFSELVHISYPFISTNFCILASVGNTLNYKTKIIDIEGDLLDGFDGEVTFLDLNGIYQQRIRDWIAFYFHYGYYGRLGTETKTILVQGINTTKGFDVGWKIKLHENKKHILSSTIELQNYDVNYIDVMKYVKEKINNNPFATINRHVPILVGVAGLDYARGINDLLGFTFSGQVMWGDSFDSKNDRWTGSSSLIFDINFNERLNVPLGLVFGSTITSEPEFVNVDHRWAKIFTMKVAYTGSREFSLGLELSALQTPVNGMDKEPVTQFVGLAAKFYF